jgi:Ca2+-transporting ATPase
MGSGLCVCVCVCACVRVCKCVSHEGQVTFFIESVTIIVVAIPEGLPLAVTISLAYSVRKMLADQNLVRVMAACETMGGATNICSDKTGTLTENLMTVTEGVFLGEMKGRLPGREELGEEYFRVLSAGIAANSSAHLGEGGKVVGNPTDGSMLTMLSKLGCDYAAERKRLEVVRAFPFSSTKKRMSTLVVDGGRTVMHTKGASEVVLETCSQQLCADGSSRPLDEAAKVAMRQHITAMAGQGLRTIGVAMKEMPGADASVVENATDRDMVLVCIVGIKDPLR